MARTTLALWMTVTFLRPYLLANSKAARMMRSEPFRVLILQVDGVLVQRHVLEGRERLGESGQQGILQLLRARG